MGVLSAFLLWMGYSMGGQTGALVALVAAVGLSGGAYWHADKLILSLYHAKEIGQDDKPALYATVAYLAERANIPRPRIFLIDENMPTIFSTGRNPEHGAVAVTKGLLDVLNKDELAGIIAHEIAHIQYQDTLLSTLAASVGGAITLAANKAQALFVFGMGHRNKGNNRLAVILMSICAPFVAIIVQMFIKQEREYLADEKAAELCENPQHVADALRKIELAREHHQLNEVEQNPSTAHLFVVNPLRSKKWQMLFASHPSIVDRIERLECMILD